MLVGTILLTWVAPLLWAGHGYAQSVGQTCNQGSCSDGSQCSSSQVCGGTNAFCYPNDGNSAGTGVSSMCAAGLNCLRNSCSSLAPVPVGAACVSSAQCPDAVTCSANVCGGSNAFCYPDDGSNTGTGQSAMCASGLNCLENYCSSLSAAPVGGTCSTDQQCYNTYCSNNVCGGDGASCSPDDGNAIGTGPSGQCGAGLNCLRNACSALSPVSLGGSCTSSSQCPGHTSCSNFVCGGSGQYCDTNDANSNDDYPCAPGLNCLSNQCSTLAPVAIGGTCTTSTQCQGGSTCSYSVCGGSGASCSADDGTVTGPSAQCKPGLDCLRNQCSSLAPTTVGGTCSSNSQCPDYIQCSNYVCAGVGAYCDLNDVNYPCASGLNCLSNRCSTISPVALGGTCSSAEQCTNSGCSDSICGGNGASCTADDGGVTGPSAQCAAGLDCLRNQCSPLAVSTVGGACSSSQQCPDSSPCSNFFCGGIGAYCGTDASTCASGLSCLQGYCSSLSPSSVGGQCGSSAQCPDGVSCGSNVCGGVTASCQPDDGAAGGSGSSTQCAPGLTCLRNDCSNLTPVPVGGYCMLGEQCPTGVSCSNFQCGGSSSSCLIDGDDSGSNDGTGPSRMCASGTCKSFTCTPTSTVGACSSAGTCPGTTMNCGTFNVCGGNGAHCTPDDASADGTGPSGMCASGLNCLQNTCSALAPVAVGGTCSASQQCPGGVQCSGNICGGTSAYCTPDDVNDADGTGASSMCAAGYNCLQNTCSTLPIVPSGGTCSSSLQCPTNEYCSNNVCGGTDAYCNPDDGNSLGTGPSATCAPGYNCLRHYCSPLPIAAAVGGTCSSSSQCPADVSCSNNVCGGTSAYCVPEDGNPSGTGPSPAQCAAGSSCLRNQCSKVPAAVLGGSCGSTQECPENIYCSSNNVCGGTDAYCNPDDGNSLGTGTSANCAAGYNCLRHYCSPLSTVPVGGSCSTASQCPENIYCSDSVCGGTGAYCAPDDGNADGTGASAQCASGLNCLQNQCSSVTPVGRGGTCGTTSQCPISVYCSNNVCGGTDAYCDPDDGNSLGTGTSSGCAAGYNCLRHYCSPLPAVSVGDSCSSTSQCPDSVTCSHGICGGNAAYCVPDDGSANGNGPSAQCASGLGCLQNACSSLAPVDNGAACSTSQQCAPNVYCSSGLCGGTDAYCSPDSGVGSTGPSSSCAAGYNCLRNYCSSLPLAALGGTCQVDKQCPDSVTCSNGVCGGSGAYCYPDNGNPDGTGASVAECASGLSCLRYTCLSLSPVALGDACQVNQQCPYNVQCATVCGGAGAFCTADDGSSTGNSAQCASGKCNSYACTVAPSTGSRKRSRAQQEPWNGCEPGHLACPVVSGRGSECINPMVNLESCGGCIGGKGLQGVDCTAIINVDVVACLDGLCVIESCIEGSYKGVGNATCDPIQF